MLWPLVGCGLDVFSSDAQVTLVTDIGHGRFEAQIRIPYGRDTYQQTVTIQHLPDGIYK